MQRDSASHLPATPLIQVVLSDFCLCDILGPCMLHKSRTISTAQWSYSYFIIPTCVPDFISSHQINVCLCMSVWCLFPSVVIRGQQRQSLKSVWRTVSLFVLRHCSFIHLSFPQTCCIVLTMMMMMFQDIFSSVEHFHPSVLKPHFISWLSLQNQRVFHAHVFLMLENSKLMFIISYQNLS